MAESDSRKLSFLTLISVAISLSVFSVFAYSQITIAHGANETTARMAIEAGVRDAFQEDQIRTNHKIYVARADGTQSLGVFDKTVRHGNQTWAFNYVSEDERPTGIPSLGRGLSVWEQSDLTESEIIAQVRSFINATKR